MSQVKFLENRLRSWTPALAQAMEDEIRRAVAPRPEAVELGCRICLQEGAEEPFVGILLEREGWGARFVVSFPSADGEVHSSTERVLRKSVLG
jgi:hypothetical protein